MMCYVLQMNILNHSNAGGGEVRGRAGAREREREKEREKERKREEKREREIDEVSRIE